MCEIEQMVRPLWSVCRKGNHTRRYRRRRLERCHWTPLSDS